MMDKSDFREGLGAQSGDKVRRLINMKVHDVISILGGEMQVIKVIGGWIYLSDKTATFVPGTD